MTRQTLELPRAVGKIGLAAIAINGLIGAGIFALPAAAANQLGLFSPWMFVLCGALMLPIILSFAFLSQQHSGTGGPVLYAGSAFGPFVGFQTGWLLYVGRVSALAANGHALVLYLSLFIPFLAKPGVSGIAVCVLIALLALINVIGVKNAIHSVLIVTLLKLLPIALFVLFGLTYLNADQLFSAPPPALADFPSAMLLLVYAFIGFEGALVPGGEAKNPKQDMPKAIVLTLVGTTILYFFIQATVVSVLPIPIETKVPLAQAADVMGSAFSIGFGSEVMLVAAIISIFGNLLALMFAAPRMTFALSEQKQLPQWFCELNTRFATPANSIYFLSATAMILALTGGFVWLAIFSSLARLIGYAICMLAVPQVAKKASSRSFYTIIIAMLGFVACLWLMAQASLKAWLFTAAFILIGSVFYWLGKKKRL